MTDMVERVAVVLYDVAVGVGTSGDKSADMAWARDAARYAIAAMREPTEDMAFAGITAPKSTATREATNTLDRHQHLTADIYRAMIDEALTAGAQDASTTDR